MDCDDNFHYFILMILKFMQGIQVKNSNLVCSIMFCFNLNFFKAYAHVSHVFLNVLEYFLPFLAPIIVSK